MSDSILVIPCFNEAERFRPEAFERHAAADPSTRFLFVNDGSTDATIEVLRKLEGIDAAHFGVIDLQPNRGKAEAVRQGMLAAFAQEPSYAGYWDADLAAPLDELAAFVRVLDQRPEIEMVFGARVNLLGRSIERRLARHYLGRVFATSVSTLLRLSVYDTQCGAKLLRTSPEMRALFDEPFCSRWVFDVEILARLIRARRDSGGPRPEDVIYELPLREWRDVPGSSVVPGDFVRAVGEVVRIYRRYLVPKASR